MIDIVQWALSQAFSYNFATIDEPVMPTLMCVCLLTAISLNFYLKSTVKSKP